MMGPEAEASLITRCRHGEAEAWSELFAQHYAPTSRFIFQLSPVFSLEDTEETCQETFLAVIKHLNQFAGQSRLQTWIFRIATNKVRDFVEKQQAAKRGSGQVPLSLDAEDPDTDLPLNPASPLPGPDLQLMRTEHYALVGRAVAQLNQPCREVVELRYFGDLSYEEISAELALNPKTVSSRLSKCLGRLGEILQKLFSEENSHSSSVQ
jgi:RNA polymerase sigma-70 factor (ECF subfamily)